MERRTEGNGWETFFEHWGLFIPVLIISLVASQVLGFFANLTGTPWIFFFLASTVLLFSGAGLIVYAKIPAYCSGRFFSFGVKTIPENLVVFYRWGWRVFLLGVVLSLCLLLSRR